MVLVNFSSDDYFLWALWWPQARVVLIKNFPKGTLWDANLELPDIEFLLPFIASLIMS